MHGNLHPRRAVILAAGAGSRLLDVEPLKPLAPVNGEPLIRHAIAAMASAGVSRVTLVLGNQAESIAAAARGAAAPVDIILNEQWATTPNGVSLLAAREHVGPGTLLMMADHLVSPLLVRRLLADANRPLALAVDRRIGHPWVDEADVTRVRTCKGPNGDSISAIGKQLCVYDCHDTGVFVIGPELLAELAPLPAPGLSDGVQRLAARGQAQAVDIGDALWLDVDDGRALAIARRCWPATDALMQAAA